MSLFGLVLAFVAVFLVLFTLFDRIAARQRTNRALRSLEDLGSVTVDGLRQRELAVPIAERVVMPGLRRIAAFGQRVTPVGVVRRLDETLDHAGITSFDGPRLLAVKILTTATGVFIGVSLVPVLSTIAAAGEPVTVDPAQSIVAVFIMSLIGYYAPEWFVRGKADARSEEIRRALPDALDLLSISVTAGLGFDAAMDRVSREMRGPLGVEMYRVVQEMRLGQSRSEALRGLGERTNVPELDAFVLAMVQAETFGVPVADVLTTQADELRVKRRQRAEELAQKIPVKILFPLIACIFPVLFTVILGPPAIQIYRNYILTQ